MMDSPDQTQANRPSLACSTIVYRAFLNRNHINKHTKAILAGAFLLRPRDEADGLSVTLASSCSAEEFSNTFNHCFGVATLHVGRIRDMGLDVEPDEDPACPDHAFITGLSLPHENAALAERIAGKLARHARRVLPVD
jgi:hypothetical protein